MRMIESFTGWLLIILTLANEQVVFCFDTFDTKATLFIQVPIMMMVLIIIVFAACSYLEKEAECERESDEAGGGRGR